MWLLLLPAAHAIEAWFADGQTWIVFEVPPDPPVTASLYGDDAPVELADPDLRIARAFDADWSAARLDTTLADEVVSGWTVPDAHGGQRTLSPEEGLFVVTPQQAGERWYAVDVGGELQTVGPVEEAVEPVAVHLQTSREAEGYEAHVYAHWADGRAWGDEAREDYPPFGNADMAGLAHLFVVYAQGETMGSPLISLFYGGKLTVSRWNPDVPSTVDLALDDGGLLVFDDGFWALDQGEVTWIKTKGLGAWSGFDRFVEGYETRPPDDAVVVPWSLMRFDWTLDQVIERYGFDDQHLVVAGHSDGGSVAGLLPRYRPDRFATSLLLVPQILGPPVDSEVTRLLGKPDQALEQALWPGVTSQDVFFPGTPLEEGELGLVTVVFGRNDPAVQTEWTPERVEHLRQLEATGEGYVLDWDERVHSAFDQDGTGHWTLHERHAGRTLVGFDLGSFPAIVNDDQDPEAEGRQPDPGTGDTADGDAWGTWGGYHRWSDVAESATRWSALLWVEDAPLGTSTADVVLRRLSDFAPEEGATLYWSWGDERGTSTMGERVELVGLDFDGEPRELVVSLEPLPEDTGSLPDTAGSPADDTAPPGSDGPEGCGCGAAPAVPWWLGLPLLVGLRRRP